ncbi:MAG: hypothetical protein FWD43_04250 [Coriobacteriia bacterium]|nr:hypothetical protein [Coriobacteriia bacterium]
MKAFGSGYFGEWVTDEQGLPAYKYDCNQLVDAKAVSPTNAVWRKENDQSFQFGNGRVVCLASNFGTVQVRQDEGSPKFLGDVDPAEHCYGGGIGWLTDGEQVLSTYFDGKADSFERLYGTGYMRKAVKKGDLSADQLIFTPYGDDPIVISQVTIENNSDQQKQVTWYEYWGSKPYPMSFRALLLSLAAKSTDIETYINNSAQEKRRKLAESYEHNYSVEGDTLRNRMKFGGWGFVDKQVWKIAQKRFRPQAETAHNYSLYLGELDEYEDVKPPETFLSALDSPVEGFITDAKAFFGAGGVDNPDGLAGNASGNSPGNLAGSLVSKSGKKMKASHSAMIAVSSVSVPANGKVTLTYVFGYIPDGFKLPVLLAEYGKNLDGLFTDSCEKWKSGRISLTIPGQEWIDRELLWHNQSLRAAATYDSAFGEHILSQGHVYQYIMGFQGASRDPLQHVMPFIFTDAGLVREIIRYTAKSILPDGTVPYGICGNGAIMTTPFLSGDLELWLIWTLSEYILATKDLSILEEKVTPYPYKGIPQNQDSILGLIKRAYKHFLANTGTGAHGLLRILGGDWNDNVVVGNADPNEMERIYKEGESVLVGAMAAAVLKTYAEVLAMAGEDNSSVSLFAQEQRDAVAKQWNGKWFKRAYLGSVIGWVDEETLWLEPQPWALMCGSADEEKAGILVNEIREKCQDPSPIGAMLADKCPERDMKAPSGMATNGGIWPSITGTLILALNKTDPAAAYTEWRKNTLAYHAENYPESWEGTWSGPDTYNSVLSEYPGRTFFVSDPEQRKFMLSWTDFPVYNLHPHAWTLYNAANLFARDFTSDGVVFNMGFPEAEYNFDSPLAALKRTSDGFEGRYCPAIEGTWKTELVFFKPEKGFVLTVNDKTAQYEQTKDGIVFYGDGGANNPLRWKITL